MVQSTPYLVEFPWDVKRWMANGPPPVAAARPARCPICLSASCDDRRGVTLYGHGLRERVQWGPPFAAQGPGQLRVEIRRYQCQLCDAVVAVVPQGMLPRKRYSGPAIAFALALWSLTRLTEPEVFGRVSIFGLSPYVLAHGWRSLRRWTSDAVAGRLWPLFVGGGASTWRQRAERISAALASFTPTPDVGSPAARAFEGAKHIGRG